MTTKSKYCILLVSLVLVAIPDSAQSETIHNGNQNNTNKEPTNNVHSSRKGRELAPYLGLISCAMKYDVSCFLDAAEDYLEVRRTDLLAEADAEAFQSTGRSDPDSRPSHLATTLSRLIFELTNMFQNGLSGFFKSGREIEDEDDSEEDEDDKNELVDTTTQTDGSNGEMREITSGSKKKKTKKPLKSLIRLIKVALIALIVVIKLAVILKVLQTAMQFKFLLISLGGFAIQAAKLWMSVKNQKDNHHEEIVYKNPYGGGGGDEYSSPGGGPYGGEYNAARSVHDLVYSLQKPL